jgi:tetratricopeptide (TPR) repeat protein
MSNESCYVLMPFGRTQDAAGNEIDFDSVYRDLIAPAIRDADLDPIRADQEQLSGTTHKPMFERLMLCRYVLADLTAASANAFYALGARHALRPHCTVLLFAAGERLPFDVQGLRCIPYQLGADGQPRDVDATRTAIADALRAARSDDTDGLQIVDDLPAPRLDRSRTDALRGQMAYRQEWAERLAQARTRDGGLEALRALEAELGDVAEGEVGVVMDLFLSYRAVGAWKDMIRLKDLMSRPLQESVMVQQQLALALNRDGRGEDAELVLLQLIARRKLSSETYGILGRVYKDRWDAARRAGEATLARGFLDEAIDAYSRGFQADWRDAYPGINALTLMELRDPPDDRSREILPVVKYSVARRLASGNPNYWDYATHLELAVLGGDEVTAAEALAPALAAIREVWEPETTALNLGFIREARARRA